MLILEKIPYWNLMKYTSWGLVFKKKYNAVNENP